MADQNSHDFDPYYKWLGIPPELQPADHYKLLGLRLFEEDREVIAIAADRQMAHVKTFATGKYSQQSQALLDELARAKLCLLNANKKVAYDASLLEEVTSFEEIATVDSKLQPAMATSKPVPQAVERKPVANTVPVSIPAENVEISVYGRLRHKKRPSRNLVVGWYILTLSLAILGYVILQLNRREDHTPSQVSERTNNSPKTAPQEQAMIPQDEPAFVSVIPKEDKRRFLVQLSSPSSTETAISYALAGKYISGTEIQKGGVVRIRPGEDSVAIPISTAAMVIAKIELLRVAGSPGITLDSANSKAFIDNSQRARPVPGDPQQQVQPNESPQPDNIFEGLPATVDLPAVRDIKITTLCSVPSGTTLTLRSSDSSLVLSGNRLEWREKGKKDLDLVGGLEISSDQLQFRWLKHVSAEAETALRNSLVKLSLENGAHTSAFRSPEIGEPFHFDLSKPNQRILGNCKHMPDMGRIHFKVFTPNELPPFNGDALPSAGLQYPLAMDMNFLDAANVKTHFEIDRVGNVPRVKLETKFQLPSGESRLLTFKHLSTAQELINYELNEIDFETNRLGELLKKPPAGQRSAIQNTIKALEARRKIVVADQIELDRVAKVAEAIDGRLLPYRFYTIVDEYEVDLILAK